MQMKKVLSILLVAVMLLSVMPLSAFATEYEAGSQITGPQLQTGDKISLGESEIGETNIHALFGGAVLKAGQFLEFSSYKACQNWNKANGTVTSSDIYLSNNNFRLSEYYFKYVEDSASGKCYVPIDENGNVVEYILVLEKTDDFEPITFGTYVAPVTYTVTWKNADGTVLETDTDVVEGTVPTYDRATPTKATDEKYMYFFSGWSPEVTAVTGDITYTAQFDKQVVGLYLLEGDVVDKDETIRFPLVYRGNEFSGHVLKVYLDGELVKSVEVQGASSIEPDRYYTTTQKCIVSQFSKGSTWPTIYNTIYLTSLHTVTWQNEDGTVLETDTDVEAGTIPTYDGATPTKADDAQYTYTFAGWSPAVTAVSGDVTYTAQFTPVAKFSVFVKKLTGGTITVSNVTGLTTVAQLKDLLVTETGVPASAMRLVFAGKQLADDKTLGEYNIQKESTIHLVIRTYTITWKSDEATIIDTTTVAYGDTPTHADAAGYEDADYTYTFAGWTPEVTAVTGEATYTATYTATPKPAEPTSTVSFTKVTSADEITAENIGTCTAEEAAAWIVANWDSIELVPNEATLFAFYSDGVLCGFATGDYITKAEFEEHPENFIVTDVQLSVFVEVFNAGEYIYLCTPAAPAPTPHNGVNLTVGNDITSNYYVDFAAYTGAAKITYTYNSVNEREENVPVTKTIDLSDIPAELLEGDRIKLTVSQAPAQMAEPAVIEILGENDVVLDTLNYSAKTYCDKVLGMSDDELAQYTAKGAELRKLCHTMIAYGQAAQGVFTDYTEHYITDETRLTCQSDAVNTQIEAAFVTANHTVDNSGMIKFSGVSFVCTKDARLRFYLNTSEATSTPAAPTASTGNAALKYTLNGAEKQYFVEVSGINAADFNEQITVNYGGSTIKLSVLDFAGIVLRDGSGASAALQHFAKTLVVYNTNALAYFD